MQHRLAYKAASVFMAFVLVCTCNSASIQPLAAFAAQGGAASATVQVPVSKGATEGVGEEPISNVEVDADMDVPVEDGGVDVGETPADVSPTDNESLTDAPTADVVLVDERPHADISSADSLVDDEVTEDAHDVEESVVPTPAPDANAAALQADGRDVTSEIDQFSLVIGAFSWKDAFGSYADVEPGKDGSYALPSPFEGIKGLRLVLDFAVLKDDEMRTIKQGDSFSFALNQTNLEGADYFRLNDTAAPQNIVFGGHLVATYVIESGVLTATFSDNVNYEEGFSKIKGGISLSFELNEDAFGAGDETGIDLVLQDISRPAHIVVPPKSSVADGVEKEGAYDPATRSIVWIVKAGTATPGIDLGGMRIVDVYDAGALEFVSASTIASDGVEADISNAVELVAGSCVYTFPSGAVSPQTVKIVTKVRDEALPSDGVSVLGNDAALEQGSSPYKPGDYAATDATVSVPGMSVQKNGEQIDGNKMQWSIVVNEKADAWLWNAVVTDVLSANLAYLDDSLTVDGKKVPVLNAEPVVAPTYDYATLLANGDGTHTLAFHFVDTESGDHDGKPIISKAHTLVFETSLVGDTVEDAKIENTASLSGSWPDGEGPGMTYRHDMGIGTEYRYAFVKKEGAVDQRTGIITWTVGPQTRLEHHRGATLVDTVDASDQEYIDGSAVLEYQGDVFDQQQLVDKGWLVISGEGAVSDPTTLSFALPDDSFPVLGDVRLSYKTQATTGFLNGTHGQQHVYRNTASLTVQTSVGSFVNEATAEVPLANDLISKTAVYEYDDAKNEGWLHYTLTANAVKMTLANAVVSDDFSQLASVYYRIDGTTLDIPSSAWTLDGTKTKIAGGAYDEPSFAGGKFSVKLGTAPSYEIDDVYTIDLYLKLTDEAKQAYLLDSGSGFIRTKNTAKIEGVSAGGAVEYEAAYETTPEGGDVVNELVDKSSRIDEGTGIIRWRVDINPQGATLANAVVKDVLNKSLQLEIASIKLFESKHDANGLISSEDPVEGRWTEVVDPVFEVEPGDDESQVLRMELPNGTESYTLVYETAIIESVNAGYVKNRASLVNDGSQKAEGSHTQELDGNSWGYLERTASYRFVKTDALGGAAQPLGSGVTFGLFADKECKQLLKVAAANGSGAFGFYGLTAGATYWYKELTAPAGYVLDQTAYELAVPEDAHGIQDGVIAVTNERLKAMMPVALTKTFEAQAGDAEVVRQARFKLVLRPLGMESGKAVGVALSGADGTYAYNGTTLSADGATELVVEVAAGSHSAMLSLSGLPWGDYELRETVTAEGYALPGAAKRFSVGQDGAVSYGDGGAELVNEKTRIALTKKLNGAEAAVAGASFSILDGEGNTITSPFTGQEFTWVPDGTPWEIVGLPAGSYVLSETVPAADTTIAQLRDVPFTVAPDGSLKLNGSVAHVSAQGNLIVADNVSCALVKLNKLDQFDRTVAGATVRLECYDGSAWKAVGEPWLTDGETLAFDGLQRSTAYRIVETSVPEGYIAAQPVEFSIDAYGTVQNIDLNNEIGTPSSYGNAWKDGTFTLRDERILGHVEFSKVAEENAGTPLQGATFDLYRVGAGANDVKVNESGSFLSDERGLVTTLGSALENVDTGCLMEDGLVPGTYYFVETSAPAGFEFDAGNAVTSGRFTVKADGSNRYTEAAASLVKRQVIALASVANTPLSASVLVHKATEGGAALLGAEFTLSGIDDDGAKVSRTEATDGDGIVRFDDVASGSYTVRETKPPAGYQLNERELSVVVEQNEAGKTYDLNNGDPVVDEQTSFTVSKVDEDGILLPGAQFVLEGEFADGSTDPLTWTSGAGPHSVTGKLVASNVYKLTERKAPEHYVVASAPREIKVDEHGVLYERAQSETTWRTVEANALTISNDPVRGHVEVEKTVVGGDGAVSDVEFDLFKQAGAPDGGDLAVARDCTTDGSGLWRSIDQETLNPDTGEALSKGLAAGSYYIVEKKATVDTQLDASPRAFEIADDDHFVASGSAVKVAFENKAFAARLELAKLDASTGEKLTGAAFSLTYVPEGGGAEQTIPVSTEGDGVYRADDLKKGSYTLRETIVPNGYERPFEAVFVLNDEHNGKTVSVRDDASAAVPVTRVAGEWNADGVTNTRTPGSLVLTKVGERGEPLQGAEFTLEKSEAGTWSVVGAFATGADGSLFAPNLAWGAYRIAETKAVDGYQPGRNAVPVVFTVGPESGTDVKLVWDRGVISNELTRIAIDKVGEGTVPERLDGASLKMSGKFADGSTEKKWASSADAAESFEGQLIVGERYLLAETERLSGYLSLPGAIAFTLNDVGQIVLEDNPTYADGSAAATLSSDGALLSVRNIAVQGVVTLAKIDADTGDALDEAEFALYDDAGTLVHEGLNTGSFYDAQGWSPADADAGELTVSGLDLGSYYFKETAAEGYQVPDTAYRFTIDEDNATKVPSFDLGTVSNRQTELSFNKMGLHVERCSDPMLGAEDPGAMMPVEGAVFTVFDDEACEHAVATATSDALGRVTFKKLPAATYWVKETAAPDGYVSDGAVYVAAFEANGQLAGFFKQGEPDAAVDTLVNDVHRADIRLKKVSETDAGKVLPNSVYGLYKRTIVPVVPEAAAQVPNVGDDLALVAKATTDTDGMLVFEGVLMDQEYVIQELEAPGGSFVSKNPIVMSFTLDKDGMPALALFNDGSGTAEIGEDGLIVWKEPQVIVEFSKKDPEGALLAGARLHVVDESGATVGDAWVSDGDEGHRVEGQLVAGKTYRLIELEAPEGYAIADDVSFSVEDAKVGPGEGLVHHVEMIDELLDEEPIEPEDPLEPPIDPEGDLLPADPIAPSGAKPKPLASFVSSKSFATELVRTGDVPLAALAMLAGGVALVSAGIAVATAVRRRRRA